MKNVTKGEAHIRPESEDDFIGIIVNSKLVCTVYPYGDGEKEEAEANANLIADAHNTHNTTGYTPSELKQQKDELLEALREIKNAEHGTYKGTPTYLKKVASDAIDKLITKYSNNENT